MKRKQQIISVVLVVIISLGLGIVLPKVLSNSVAATSINYEQRKENIKKGFQAELTQTIKVVEEKANQALAQEMSSADPASASNETPNANPQESSNANPQETSSADPVSATQESKSAALPPATKESSSTKDNTQPQTELVEINDPTIALANSNIYVKDEWINQKINENKEEINTNDLDVGAAIYNSLDTDFLFQLADEGLTPEERKQVDDYLARSLSGSDYEIAKELYFKYVGLLNND